MFANEETSLATFKRMIISHKHKFIFIKTEKTAGTSIEIALSRFCGENDIITPISPADERARKELGYPGPQNYYVPFSKYTKQDWLMFFYKRKRRRFYNHISALEIKKYVTEDIWNSYYKFSIERNPYDKVVSWYYWVGQKYTTIFDFIMSGRASKVRGFELYTIDSIPVVDRVYKFEELPEALEDLRTKLNLDSAIELPSKKTKGNVRKDKRPYQEILSDRETDLIAKIFAREIKFFDYEL